MKSVLQEERKCMVCERSDVLHSHHIIYGRSNRKKSEKYGYKVWLCPCHHNMSNEGVHFNKLLDIQLKQMAQRHYESHHGSRSDFIQEFGRSWL